MASDFNNEEVTSIAIIGMAGSFPKSKDIDEFWLNLKQGINCISHYSEQELTEANIEKEFLNHAHYVKAKGTLENIDHFDAHFFDIGPREAELMDPQHRLMLECACHALEHAGYNPDAYQGLIGIFAGESMSSYAFLNVLPTIQALLSTQSLQAAIGNDKDSLTTTVAYHLNLRGPAITVQTASSSSLVAVSLACQQLLSYQCDIALAGGVSAGPPIISGYLYEEGGISSPDGKCRPFDAKSNGFVPGSGVGLVVLKRLDEAIRDKDTIWATIRGFAVNNDGNKKVSYSAPSVDAQAEVISMAQEYANIDPETISYIEAHGTATNLGDPIEIAALTQAFRRKTQKNNFCAIGSVKSNIGHLDTAAGVAGLIKAALCLKYKTIVPTLNFETPNPALNLPSSPFYVSTQLSNWKSDKSPLRAGVTSLGMGGTNSHVILEEAPLKAQSMKESPTDCFLTTLSAKTPSALCQHINNISAFLKKEDILSLADVAYTLNVGRRVMKYRASFVASTKEELLTALQAYTRADLAKMPSHPKVIFQYLDNEEMSHTWHNIYQTEFLLRETIHHCLQYVSKESREVLLSIFEQPASLSSLSLVDRVLFSFVSKYALATFWIGLGIIPEAQLGQGIGELVAAVVAGVMNLETAVQMVQSQLNDKIMTKTISLSSPKVPFVSHLTGTWIKEEEAKSISYWQTWNFKSPEIMETGLQLILDDAELILGMGECSLFLQAKSEQPLIHISSDLNIRVLYEVLGKLSESGFNINWSNFYQGRNACRIPLPLYPFEKKRYWIEPKKSSLENRSKGDRATNYQPRPVLVNPYIPPSTMEESKIVKIWEDELCIQPIGITDDFFDLGGCSLVATSLITVINNQFQNKITLKDFYVNPTIQAIAKKTENQPVSIDFEALMEEVSSLASSEKRAQEN